MLCLGAAWVLVSSPSQSGDTKTKAKAGIIARKKKTSNLELVVFLNKCFKGLLLLVDSDFPVRIDFSHSFLIR